MTYKNLTEKILNDLLEDLKYLPVDKPFMLYTGLEGIKAFDWAVFIKFSGIIGDIQIKHFHNYYRKKINIRYINLLTKKGDYRLKVYYNKENNIELYKGTKFIMSTNNFNDINKYNYI